MVRRTGSLPTCRHGASLITNITRRGEPARRPKILDGEGYRRKEIKSAIAEAGPHIAGISTGLGNMASKLYLEQRRREGRQLSVALPV
jgi:hypothetical protein